MLVNRMVVDPRGIEPPKHEWQFLFARQGSRAHGPVLAKAPSFMQEAPLYCPHMIYLGSDHAGYELKQAVARHLEASGKEYKDLGNAVLDPSDDYPDYAFAVGEAVTKDSGSFGILACGSAQGVCIVANKVKGIRAAAVMDGEGAAKTRAHNDANVLCLSGWNTTGDGVMPIVDAFISTPFSGEERHTRRLGKISDYERRG